MLKSAFCGLLLILLGSAAPGEEPAVDPPPTTARAFFTGGNVVRFKARRIKIEYDLGKPESLADFRTVNPFLEPHQGGFRVRSGALEGSGVCALVHRGVFDADVILEATLVSETPRDIGAVLVQPGVTEQFLLFALADNFFCRKDRQKPGQHMITVVGAETTDGDRDEAQFRYLKRATKPALAEGGRVEIKVRKQGEINRFEFAGTVLSGTDQYGKFPKVQPGLYVLESKMRVTSLTISGRLSEEWLAERGIAFDPEEKDDAAPPKLEPVKNDPGGDRPRGGRGGRGGGRGGAGRLLGEGAAMDLVRKLRDEGAPEKDRKAASEGLTRKNVKIDEFRALVDCLYSDDLTTRTLAISVLKTVTGKTLGYHPKAPEKDRRKAARNWFRYLMENRERLR